MIPCTLQEPESGNQLGFSTSALRAGHSCCCAPLGTCVGASLRTYYDDLRCSVLAKGRWNKGAREAVEQDGDFLQAQEGKGQTLQE